MDKIKYIVFSLLLLCLFCVQNFLFMNSVYSFQREYDYTTFFANHHKQEDMFEDIKKSASKYELDVFCVTSNSEDFSTSKVTIYGTENAYEKIRQKSKIEKGTYKGVLSDKIIVEVKPLETLTSTDGFYYLIGTDENQENFKKDLVDKYAGKFPQKGIDNNNILLITSGFWVLIIFIMFLYSYYNVVALKKSVITRVSFGESLLSIVWKNMVLNAVIMCFLYAVIFVITKFLFYNKTLFDVNIYFLIATIILNTSVYLKLCKFDVKELFSNSDSNEKILYLSYFFKLIAILLLPVFLTSNIIQITIGAEYFSQKKFFNAHSDYYYVSFIMPDAKNSAEDIKNNFEIAPNLYREFYIKNMTDPVIDGAGAEVLCLYGGTHEEKNDILIFNKNSKNLIKEVVNADELTGDFDYYFIIPKDMNNEEVIENIKSNIKNHYGYIEFDSFEINNQDFSYNVITYDNKNAKILNLDGEDLLLSHYSQEPLIIYDTGNREESILTTTQFSSYIFYKFPDSNYAKQYVEQFLTEKGLTELGWKYNIQNVNSNYTEKLNLQIKFIVINSAIVLLFLIIEFILITTIIKLHYKINSVELAVKKMFGYSITERNRKLFAMIIAGFVLLLISSIAVAIFLRTGLLYCLIADFVMFIFEMLVFYINIIKQEKRSIVHVLKGEMQ